jgi:hypothetical protein
MKVGLLAAALCIFGWDPYRPALPGARAAALGGAFVALADDSSAVTHNPAGLVQARYTSLGYEFCAFVRIDRFFPFNANNFKFNFDHVPMVAFVYPFPDRPGAWALSYFCTFYQDTSHYYGLLGPSIAWAFFLDPERESFLSVGATGGLLVGRKSGNTALGAGANVGLLLHALETLNFGLAVRAPGWVKWLDVPVEETLPAVFQLGTAWKIRDRPAPSKRKPGSGWLEIYRIVLTADLEYEGWNGIRFTSDQRAPAPEVPEGLGSTVHPHLGLSLAEGRHNVHGRIGFFTQADIHDNGDGTAEVATQYMTAIGIGAFAGGIRRTWRFEGVWVSTKLLGAWLADPPRNIEQFLVTAEYRFNVPSEEEILRTTDLELRGAKKERPPKKKREPESVPEQPELSPE